MTERASVRRVTRLKDAFYISSQGKTLLGLSEIRRIRVAQRFLFVVTNVNLALFDVLVLWNFLSTNDNSSLRFLLGFIALICLTFSCIYGFMVSESLYSSWLKWCDEVQLRFWDVDSSATTFTHISMASNKAFWFIKVAPTVYMASAAVQILVLSWLNGRLEPLVPVYLPWLPSSSLANRVFCMVNQSTATTSVFVAFVIALGTLYVTLKHLVAQLQIIQVFFSNKATLGKAIEMHAYVIEALKRLIAVTKLPILAMELSSYASLLFFWLTFWLEPSLAIVAAASNVGLLMYSFLCWMNENLLVALNDFQGALYDLKWYEMSPSERRNLFLVMVSTNRQFVMTSGSFHVVSLQNIGRMLRRVYSYGIVIKDATAHF